MMTVIKYIYEKIVKHSYKIIIKCIKNDHCHISTYNKLYDRLNKHKAMKKLIFSGCCQDCSFGPMISKPLLRHVKRLNLELMKLTLLLILCFQELPVRVEF